MQQNGSISDVPMLVNGARLKRQTFILSFFQRQICKDREQIVASGWARMEGLITDAWERAFG